MRLARILALALGLASPSAEALAQSEYQPPPHVNTDEIAISFVVGRYVSPVTCKLEDGSQIDVFDSIELKSAPESGGGKAIKATFYGIQVEKAAYCYSTIERRAPDRRGVLYLHFRGRNRPDYGMSEFKRLLRAGPLVYNAHRGALQVRAAGAEEPDAPPQRVEFDGGDSRMIVEGIVGGSDGAKLLTHYFEKNPPDESKPSRYLSLRFVAKDGSAFTFYAIQDVRR